MVKYLSPIFLTDFCILQVPSPPSTLSTWKLRKFSHSIRPPAFQKVLPLHPQEVRKVIPPLISQALRKSNSHTPIPIAYPILSFSPKSKNFLGKSQSQKLSNNKKDTQSSRLDILHNTCMINRITK